jgi:hypothetical protein
MAGKIKSIEDAPTPTGQVFKPDIERHWLYREALKRHEEIYKLLIH